MKCPVCNTPDSRVLDSRPVYEDTSIKRRRECPVCGKRFTTYEFIENVSIEVVKKNGEHVPFDKHKLLQGIARACMKRPVDPVEIANAIELELQNSLVSEVTSREIGDMVLARLRDADIVAYIRFASVYRDFCDIDSFMKEIRTINKEEKKRSDTVKAAQEKGD